MRWQEAIFDHPTDRRQQTDSTRWTATSTNVQFVWYSYFVCLVCCNWLVRVGWYILLSGSPVTCSCARTSTPASARERSMAHRERISSALRRAQLLQLEKRTEYAWRLQMQSLGRYLIQKRHLKTTKKTTMVVSGASSKQPVLPCAVK